MANCTVMEKCQTQVEFIGYIYFLTLICGFGIVFNAANLSVFLQKSFSQSIAPATWIYITGKGRLRICVVRYCILRNAPPII